MSNGQLFQTETAECLKPRDAVKQIQVFDKRIASSAQADRNAGSLTNNEVDWNVTVCESMLLI